MGILRPSAARPTTCDHSLGLPVYSGYEGLNALLACWSDPGPLGCARLRCAR
jgi:hypothetical protein